MFILAKLINCNVCKSEFYGNKNSKFCSPSCKQKDYRSRNDSGFLYLLFKGDDIVYVGKSSTESGAESRVSNHRNGNIYEHSKDFDTYEISEEMDSISLMECHYIAKLEPKLNKRLPASAGYHPKSKLTKKIIPLIEMYVDSNVESILPWSDCGGYLSNDQIENELSKFINKLKNAEIIK